MTDSFMTKHLCFGELIQIIHCSYTSEGLSHRSLMKPLKPVLVKHKISVVPLMTERRNSEFDLTLVHSLEDLPFFEGVLSNIHLRKSQENMLERLGLR